MPDEKQDIKFFIFSTARLFIVLILFTLCIGIALYFVINYQITGEEVRVPKLVGKDAITALELSNKNNLILDISSKVFNSDVPKGSIVSQHPEEGTFVKKGRNISVVISKGTRDLLFPDVRNTKLTESIALLHSNNIEKVRKIYKSDFDNNVDNILGQYPPAGTKLKKDDEVNLLISEGYPKIKYVMPDLSGILYVDIIKLFENMNVYVNSLDKVFSDTLPEGTIVKQKPYPGMIIKENDIVTITTTTNVKQKNEEFRLGKLYIIRYNVPLGFFEKEIKVVVKTEYGEETIYNDVQEPGSELKLTPFILGSGKVEIYLSNKKVKTYEIRDDKYIFNRQVKKLVKQ